MNREAGQWGSAAHVSDQWTQVESAYTLTCLIKVLIKTNKQKVKKTN